MTADKQSLEYVNHFLVVYNKKFIKVFSNHLKMLYAATYDGKIWHLDDDLEERLVDLQLRKKDHGHVTSIARSEQLACMGTLGGRVLFFEGMHLENAYCLDSAVAEVKKAGGSNFYALSHDQLYLLDNIGIQKEYIFPKQKKKISGPAASCLDVFREKVLFGCHAGHIYALANGREPELLLSLPRPAVSLAQTEFLTYISYGSFKEGQALTLGRKNQVVEKRSFPSAVKVIYTNGTILAASGGELAEMTGLQPSRSRKIAPERISGIKSCAPFIAASAGRTIYLLDRELEVVNEKELPDLITAIG